MRFQRLNLFLAGWLASRWGNKQVILLGSIVIILGFLGLSQGTF
jgi:dipeptide/tripeptide permease